jgi:hypothetical protein
MDFKNPLAGMSKTTRYVTIGGAAAIGGYMVIHHHSTTGSWNPWSSTNAAATTNSAGTATSIDPITGLAYTDDNAIDPITGLAYLAEATEYGSVATAEASVSAYGQSTATGTGIGVNPASPAPAGTPNPVVGSSVYTSNAAWSTAAQAGLTDIGYSATDVATALGDYLTGTPVTATQAGLINTAIAEFGPPPSGNPQIIQAPVSQPSPTTGTIPVPDIVGDRIANATSSLTSAGLRYAGPAQETDKEGTVTSQSPSPGTKVASGSTVTVKAKFT